jgi:hypothetical protein
MDPGAINHVLPLILSAMSSRATFVRVEVPPHTHTDNDQLRQPRQVQLVGDGHRLRRPSRR